MADTLVDDLQATLQASGPLARFELRAQLQTHDQFLQAQARIEAGSAPPLPQLQARLQRLDLQRLNDHWPRTALTGHIDAQLEAQPAGRAAQPLGLTVRIDNPQAGRWETGHLPLRQLDLSARGRPTSVDEGQVDRLLLQLGSEREPAGRIQATGRWLLAGSGPQRRLSLQLGANLEGLQPARLHPSAPTLRLRCGSGGRWP
jgi:translocation and assembly module TamB